MQVQDLPVDSLSRAIIRQYLYQNKLMKTYQTFEEEETRSNIKVTKSAIVKNLCLEHLVFANRKSPEPYKSLLEVLVNYLKTKYLNKKKEAVNNDKSIGKVGSVTSQNFYFPTSTQAKSSNQNGIQIKPINTGLRPGSARKQYSIIKQEPFGGAIVKPPVLEKTLLVSTSHTNGQKDQNQNQKDVLTSKNNQKIVITEKQKEKQKQQPLIVNHPLARTISEGNPVNIQQKQQKKMISMFGKRRIEKKDQSQKEKDHDIFTTPIQQATLQLKKYVYSPMMFEPFVIKNEVKTDLVYKKISGSDKNKKKQKSIAANVSQSIRKLMFQGQAKNLPKAWKQGILLSPFDNTFYGLQQLQGGPCGIIAALQCYYLKHLLYLCKLDATSLQTRQMCVVAAISDLLYSINPSKVILALPSTMNTFGKDPTPIEDVELITINQPNGLSQIYQSVYQNKSYFLGNNNSGYTLLLYSCILTKGVDAIVKEMDSSESSLIGNHGHCNQQLVNLFITGKAATNVFNGIKVMGEDNDKIELKGIENQAEFGFLTVFETLGYVQVGSNLKNPKFPIWIICKQFHYHVIFGNNFLISQNNKVQKFDLVYFDGLYNCADRIILTLKQHSKSEDKVTNLPLIEQVLLTKWGRREVDWNGSIKIL